MMTVMMPIALAAAGGLLAGFWARGRVLPPRQDFDPDAIIDWLLNESPLPLTVSRLEDGQILGANARFASCFKLRPEEITGRSTVEIGLLSPQNRTDILKRIAKQPIITVNLKEPNRLKNQNHLLNALVAKTRYRKSPALLSAYLNEYDQAVRDRQILALAMEKLNEVVVITNRRGVIQYANANFGPVTGMEPQDAVGRYLTSLTGLACSDNLLSCVLPVLSDTGSWQGQHYIKDLNEQRHLIEASVTRVEQSASSDEHYILVGRDVTETAQLERALAQAQRLEALGTLTAGIAHDLNNALMPIMGYAELGLDDHGPESPVHENLQIIMHSAQRCKEMVQHILRSSRPHKAEPQAVRIQSIINETVKLLRFSLPPTIEIVHGLDEHCRPVLIDPTQIYQVIMNLGTNAYHAIGAGPGNIFIYLTEIAVDAPRPPLEKLKPGIYAKLAVIDSGAGMAPAIKERVFEPFFSTKSGENGTGMGLYITHNIVTSHAGAITLDSQPGGGTAVNVYLPCVLTADDESSQDVTLNPLGGAERLLIVDDEIFVAEMLKTMVSRLGYQITLAHSGQEALEIFKAAPQDFDLLITDQSMTGLTGLSLAEAATRIKPQLPVVLITGLGDEFDEGELKRNGVKKVLHKPIALRVIACAIRGELDRAKSAA